MKKLTKSNGFGLILTVFILIVLLGCSAVGFLVYKNNSLDVKTATNAPGVTTPTLPSYNYDGWSSFNSLPNKVTLKYPSNYLPTINSSNNMLFLASSETEKLENDKCAKAWECYEYNFAIHVESFPKTNGQKYGEAVSSAYSNASTRFIGKISGYDAYQDADAISGISGYVSYVFIDMSEKVVVIQGDFNNAEDIELFKKIAYSATLAN